jgi:hypothetical protein
VDGACLYCHVAVVDGQLHGGQVARSYRCLTDESQEGDGESEMSYTLNIPDRFLTNNNKAKLDTGSSTICIIGGSAVRTPFGKPDFVVIPDQAVIRFIKSLDNSSWRRSLVQTGTRTVLLVRVTAPSSSQSSSAAVLASTTFGTGGQTYSMAGQYSSCSAGKLNFVAASGYGSIIQNGVMDLALPSSIVNQSIFDLENSMTTAVKNALPVSDLYTAFSNVIFCMPDGTTFNVGGSKDWLAYAYLGGKFSYFNNGKCSMSYYLRGSVDKSNDECCVQS